MTLVIDPKVALLKGVDPVQFCVFLFGVLALNADGGRKGADLLPFWRAFCLISGSNEAETE